ncbi:MAG: DUF4157 domain-containing protein [Bryobacteraceae bacterium]|nr:DUF4157 domain-containing protein [Bryobacteraceae bacterium]
MLPGARPFSLGILLAQPVAQAALETAAEYGKHQWSRLSTGEQVFVVTSGVITAGVALGAVLPDPELRQTVLDKLNGGIYRIPFTPFSAEIFVGQDSYTLGLHLDMGTVLPPWMGFRKGLPFLPLQSPMPQLPPLQLRAASSPDDTPLPKDLPARIRSISHNGRPIESPARETLERVTGVDLSDVRVQTGTEADQLTRGVQATAFTAGHQIFFRNGAYHPESEEGLRLLAHEAAHTVQQAAGPVTGDAVGHGLHVSRPNDRFEVEADRVASRIAAPDRAGLHQGLPAWAERRVSPSIGPAAGHHTQVRQGPALPLFLQRKVSASEKCGSQDFYGEYRVMIWAGIQDNVDSIQMPSGSPYAYWLWGKNNAVSSSVVISLMDLSWEGAKAALAPGDLDMAIRRGRDADLDTGLAPGVWRKETSSEVRALMVTRLSESMQRLGPQYVAASYLGCEALRKKNPDAFIYKTPQVVPGPGELLPSHPIDKLVIKGLTHDTGVGQLQVNYKLYVEEGHASTAEKELKKLSDKPVTYSFELSFGNYFWVRVSGPPDATAADVAKALYGDPALANSITAAPPMFSFTPRLLSPEIYKAWSALVPPTVSFVANDPNYKADPAQDILRSKSAEEAALGQSKKLPPTGKTPNEIVSRLRLTVQLLDEISGHLSTLGVTGVDVSASRGLVDARSKKLATSVDATDPLRWDSHSEAEHNIVKAAASGLRTAASNFAGMSKAAPAPGGRDPASYSRTALMRIARAYGSAAAVCELPETAFARLGEAENASRNYPIEIMEGILAYVRDMLAARAKDGAPSKDSYGVGKLEETEKNLRERLFAMRELLVRDPAKVQKLFEEIQGQVSDLGDMTSMATTMEALETQWNFLLTHQGIVGDFTTKNAQYDKAMEAISSWKLSFYSIYLGYQSEHASRREEARGQLAELRKQGPQFQQAVDTVAKLIEVQETRERWITLGLKIAALIGIALVTAGVGAYVSGALMVGAGWGATTAGIVGATLLSSGAEAFTFTVLSTTLLGKDPNSSLAGTFFENWALFGALKGLSIAYEAGVGVEMAAGMIGKGGNLALGLSAQIAYSMARRNAESKAQGGNGLTPEEAQQITLESLAVAIGTVLVARYGGGKVFLEGAAVRGEKSFLAEFATVDATRNKAFAAARGLSRTSKPEQIKKALAADSEALQAEVDLSRKMETWATENKTNAQALGIDPVKLAELRTINESAIVARKRTSIAMELDPAGGSIFHCKPGRLTAVAKAYAEIGDIVTESIDPVTGEKSITVRPKEGGPTTLRIVEPAVAPPAPDPARFKLTTLFQSLTTEQARAQFDLALEKLGPEKARSKFEGMQKGGKSLEQALLDEAAATAAKAAPKTPFGPALADAIALDAEIEVIKKEAEASGVPGWPRWVKRLNDTQKALRPLLNGEAEASALRLSGSQNSVKGIRPEIADALSRKAEIANHQIKYDKDGASHDLDIDNVSGGGKVWTEVKEDKPFTTGSQGLWAKGIYPKVQKMLIAAPQHGVTDIVVSFRAGVDPGVKAALEAMSVPGGPTVRVEGPIVPAVKPTGNP